MLETVLEHNRHFFSTFTSRATTATTTICRNVRGLRCRQYQRQNQYLLLNEPKTYIAIVIFIMVKKIKLNKLVILEEFLNLMTVLLSENVLGKFFNS